MKDETIKSIVQESVNEFKPGDVFYMPLFISHCRHKTRTRLGKNPMEQTIKRIFQQMREDGEIDYILINTHRSLYCIVTDELVDLAIHAKHFINTKKHIKEWLTSKVSRDLKYNIDVPYMREKLKKEA